LHTQSSSSSSPNKNVEIDAFGTERERRREREREREEIEGEGQRRARTMDAGDEGEIGGGIKIYVKREGKTEERMKGVDNRPNGLRR